MNFFTQKISSLLKNDKGPTPDQEIESFDFIKKKKNILKALTDSQKSGKLIGVYSKAFGEGMILTAVEEIDATLEEAIIEFKRYDISGLILLRARVALSEIEMVCPFNRTYHHPVLAANAKP